MITSPSTESSSGDKQKPFGNLEVKVLETRELNLNMITGKVEFTPRMSEVKKHNARSHQFSDVFLFNVSRPDVDLVIEAWRKNIFTKDKLQATLRIPISSLLDEQPHSGWYPLPKAPKGPKHAEHTGAEEKKTPAPTPTPATTAATPAAPTEGEKPAAPAPTEGTEAAPAAVPAGEEKEKEKEKAGRKRAVTLPGSSKKKPSGEIRLELKFTKNAPPKEVLTGTVIHDKWTKETSGGGLINNCKWSKNPQFLLHVDNPADITIKLRQPEESTQRASFYVVHYDGFYNGRRKVVLDTSEIVKVDNFFCPITAVSVDSTMALGKGRYLIIPYAETVGYEGTFTIAVSGKNNEDLDLYRIPKDPEQDWNELRVEGAWEESTAGGGDILGLNWRKNPQYGLTLTKPSDVCAVIEQDENTRSIGLYLVKQIDVGKKVVDYAEEIGKTDSFKYLCSTGLKIPNVPAGSYVIIPCTFDADVYGPFRIIAYVNDPSSTLALVENEWPHTKELKGAWEEGKAGGSPNNITFTKNPQYLLKFHESDKPVNILLQLVQESAHYEEASIGFVVVKAKEGESKKFEGEESFAPTDIFCKPDGWVPKVDVVCRATIPADQKDRTFVIIPSTFKPDVHRSFQLNVHSDGEFTLESL